jgi:hypothetical protein
MEESGRDSSTTAQKTWTQLPQTLQGCPCRISPAGNLQANPSVQRGIATKVGRKRKAMERFYDDSFFDEWERII